MSIDPPAGRWADRRLPFLEGAHVRRGQTLFRIDSRHFRAEVNQLAADLACARRLLAQNSIPTEQASTIRSGLLQS